MGSQDHWPSTHLSLLEGVRNLDDRESWQRFVDLYAPLIFRICRLRGLQDADASDVTQEVFKQVARAMQSFEYDQQRGRFRNWLGVITRREVERWRRRTRKQLQGRGGSDSFVPVEPKAEFEDQWTSEFNARIYEAALDRVRERVDGDVWEAFAMVWIQNRKPQDAAQQLGRTAGWIYKAKFNVIRKLHEEVDLLVSEFL